MRQSVYASAVAQQGLSEAHEKLLAAVPPGATVLEVGCASGYFTRALLERGAAAVDGIEIDAEDAARAEPHLRRLIVDSVESAAVTDTLDDEAYDAVVCGDVLEHLRNPGAVVRALVPKLRRGGVFVVSIPNIAHHSVRFGLLLGRFEYEELGLLDKTHLRFFTQRSVRELLRSAGLEIVREDFTYGRGKSFLWRVELLQPVFHRSIRPLMPVFPGLLAFQFVVTARRP